jgi:hypothetical protein
MASVGVVVAGMVSSGHHWYGAIVYDTPWRLVVSLWIPAFVVVVVSALYLYYENADQVIGNVSLWVVLFAGVVFQTGFTMFECVYSHVLKVALFYGGASPTLLERLFPAPAYHLPDNILFELTGILQLVGLWAAWLAYRVFRSRAKANP